MREALKNGGTMVGGLDPAGIDYAIEESLETIFDLAEEFQVGIDIHLHDTGKWVFIQLINFRHFGRTKIYSANRYQSRLCALDVRPAEKKTIPTLGNASNGDYVYNSL